MSLKEAKAELKALNLPTAFIPRGTGRAVLAVNVNEADLHGVCNVMMWCGYHRTDTYCGTDTDYQLCFSRTR